MNDRLTLGDDDIVHMRDRMTHRGPDGAGMWRTGHVAMAHRRLAVIDPTPSGAQPMAREIGGRCCVLNYNGELYNDVELRHTLEGHGFRFDSGCDTETVLAALIQWGVEALGSLRGMYALTFYDGRDETLLMARDPLGVKPLYWWRGKAEGDACESIVAASEIPVILEHPGIDARADLFGVSAYLTTIRTSLGERTLYQGVRCVRPGEAIVVSLGELSQRRVRHWPGAPRRETEASAPEVREAITDCVRLQLRADVPTCALLSGGLDSSIIAHVASSNVSELRTYCSGAQGGTGDDFEHARLVAGALGVRHVEAPVDRAMFCERWAGMVERMGMPLSTPNEVAINEVARTLRADGAVVTLSGEGADELFGGYAPAMSQAAAYVDDGDEDAAMFQLSLSTWIPSSVKSVVLNADVWRALESDHGLVESWRATFDEARTDGPEGDPLQAHLRSQRRINLSGLLARLDTATMLESVEGRTPFADRVVADLAEQLPMRFKFGAPDQTKRVLRKAFGDALPGEVVARQKASFPLPFESWIADRAEALRASAFSRSIFAPAAIETVAAEPERHWNLAWPMINLAMWGQSVGLG